MNWEAFEKASYTKLTLICDLFFAFGRINFKRKMKLERIEFQHKT
jgi:hypothetical protein